MRRGGLRQSAVLLLILALPAAGRDAGARQPPQRQAISEELAALVRGRWEAIELEAAGLPADEWAGSYVAFGGPTFSTQLAWSPSSGFVVWWENCSRPHTPLVNYGGATFTNGTLRLTPELREKGPNSYPTPAEFVPVRWGEQRLLIPSDELIRFAYAVTSNSVEEVESFLVKREDYDKERKGLPNLPAAYRKYLRAGPIRAAVSGFGPDAERWYPNVVLNAGRAEGVVRGMKFYLSRPRGVHMQLHVTHVREHTSEARVVMVGFTDDREGSVRPRVGWKFTSRAP